MDGAPLWKYPATIYAISSVVNSAIEITIPRTLASAAKDFSMINLLRFNFKIRLPKSTAMDFLQESIAITLANY